MLSAELLTLGVDGPLGDRLAHWSQDHGLWHRPLQHASALGNLLRKGSRGVLLVRVGRDLVGEFETLRDAIHQFPELTTIVLGDQDHPLLEGLSYDLGASAVLFPPHGSDELFEMLALWAAAKEK